MVRSFLLMVVCLSLAGLASAQSLAGAAEKEKARRLKIQKSGVKAKSYTDDDLRKPTDTPFNVVPETKAAAGSPSEKGQGQKAEDGDDAAPTEKSAEAAAEPSAMDRLRARIDKWRARYREVKAEVDELEREVADLTKRTQPGETGGLIVYPGDGVNPPGVVAEGDVLAQRLAEARRKLEAAKQRLEEVREAARRDGVGSAQL